LFQLDNIKRKHSGVLQSLKSAAGAAPITAVPDKILDKKPAAGHAMAAAGIVQANWASRATI
jgi:hypothetical protein